MSGFVHLEGVTRECMAGSRPLKAVNAVSMDIAKTVTIGVFGQPLVVWDKERLEGPIAPPF